MKAITKAEVYFKTKKPIKTEEAMRIGRDLISPDLELTKQGIIKNMDRTRWWIQIDLEDRT